MEETLKFIEENKLMGTIRTGTPEDAEVLVKASIDGGLKLLSISMNTPNALKVIEKFKDTAGIMIGAGTVLDGESAQKAFNAGARFIMSPYTEKEVITVCKYNRVLCIQGAATPTEAMLAHNLGAQIIKVFPADTVGGPSFIKQLHHPIHFLKLMPSGGVSLDNVLEYLKAGAVAVALGGAIYDRSLIRSDDWGGVKERVRQFVEKLETLKAAK